MAASMLKGLLGSGTKTAVKDSAATAAKATAKNAAVSAAKTAATKTLSTTLKTTAKAAGKTLATVGKKGGAFILANKKMVAAGIITATVAGVALARAENKDGKKFGITNITNAADGSGVQVTYDTPEDIHEDDALHFTDTDCVPPLGEATDILQIVSKTVVIVSAPALTTDGTKGNMILDTSFENQAKLTAGDAGELVGKAAVVAGSAAAGAVGLEIGGFKTYAMYAAIALVVCSIIVVILKIAGIM